MNATSLELEYLHKSSLFPSFILVYCLLAYAVSRTCLDTLSAVGAFIHVYGGQIRIQCYGIMQAGLLAASAAYTAEIAFLDGYRTAILVGTGHPCQLCVVTYGHYHGQGARTGFKATSATRAFIDIHLR